MSSTFSLDSLPNTVFLWCIQAWTELYVLRKSTWRSYKDVYAAELSWLFTKMDPYVTNTHSPNQPTHPPTHSLTQKIKRFLFMCTCVVPSVKFRNSLQQNTSIGYFRNAMIPFSVALWNYRSILFPFYFHILDLVYSMWPGQYHGQYQGSRWPGDTRSQGFSSNGI